jgi:RimJ/RimL family protein N-acetyltransferase
MQSPTLQGTYIRLEPLEFHHIGALVAASNVDSSLYQWSPVPRTTEEATKYIETALAWRDAGTAVPFVTVRLEDNQVIGSTRFFEITRWNWPPGHALYGRSTPDICEIGYTWLTRSAIRTPANTEAKLLMLTHAFEVWDVRGVCLHTDVRNTRSRAAIERIGGKMDGILRAHRMAADFTPRDSARYSIIRSEWPEVKALLRKKLGLL